MTKRTAAKLTPAEAKRLEQYIDKNDGQVKVGGLLSVTVTTLSRTVNRHTAPSPMLREKLVEAGVIKL